MLVRIPNKEIAKTHSKSNKWKGVVKSHDTVRPEMPGHKKELGKEVVSPGYMKDRIRLKYPTRSRFPKYMVYSGNWNLVKSVVAERDEVFFFYFKS